MPPRAGQGQNSFAAAQDPHQVICPLKNQDGTICRKRCLGEKRFRSMQEHIRRAHPDHYIPKLPATEESFHLMINTPPHARPPPPPGQVAAPPHGLHHRPSPAPSLHHARGGARDHRSIAGIGASIDRELDHEARSAYGSPAPGSRYDDAYPSSATATTAAVALAQLHHSKQDSDWGSEVDTSSEHDYGRHKDPYELPPLQTHFSGQPIHDPFAPRPGTGGPGSARARELLPSVLSRSPPGSGRSTTLPPFQRSHHHTHPSSRPRKASLAQSARKPKHERQRSRELQRRGSNESNTSHHHLMNGGSSAGFGRGSVSSDRGGLRGLGVFGGGRHASLTVPFGYSRKASSAEPASLIVDSYQTRRWEDLIEAATSATEADSDRDMTPIPQSPPQQSRSSLPPLSSHFSQYGGTPPSTSAQFPPSAHHPPPMAANEKPASAVLEAYKASPLQRTMTPPPTEDLVPSVESSVDSHHSGNAFHMRPTGLSSSSGTNGGSDVSPTFSAAIPSSASRGGQPLGLHPASSNSSLGLHASPLPPHARAGYGGAAHGIDEKGGVSNGVSGGDAPSTNAAKHHDGLVQIYCANCHRTSALRDSYACSECIGGFCPDCVFTLNGESALNNESQASAVHRDGEGEIKGEGEGAGRPPCPRCRSRSNHYRLIQLELT